MGALSRIDVVRGAIADFLGEGSNTSTVSKGKFDGKSLKVSKLNEGDVTSATCTLSSDKKYYDVTITVRNEDNLSKSSSALGKFTLDYKDASEMKAGLSEAGASVDTIALKSTKAVIKARIAVDSLKFTSIRYDMNMEAVFSNVRYTIVRVSTASGKLTTSVEYSNFKY